jgi:hypothetical protein
MSMNDEHNRMTIPPELPATVGLISLDADI